MINLQKNKSNAINLKGKKLLQGEISKLRFIDRDETLDIVMVAKKGSEIIYGRIFNGYVRLDSINESVEIALKDLVSYSCDYNFYKREFNNGFYGVYTLNNGVFEFLISVEDKFVDVNSNEVEVQKKNIGSPIPFDINALKVDGDSETILFKDEIYYNGICFDLKNSKTSFTNNENNTDEIAVNIF